MSNFALSIRDIIKNRQLLYSSIVFNVLVIWDWMAVLYVIATRPEYNGGRLDPEDVIITLTIMVVNIILNVVIIYLSFTRIRTWVVAVPSVLFFTLLVYVAMRITDDPGAITIGIILGLFYSIFFYLPAVWLYYRFRQGLIAFGWLSIFFMTTLIMAEAIMIDYNSVTALLKLDVLIIASGYFFFAALLLIFENASSLAKWENRVKYGLRFPKRTLIPMVIAVLLATFVTILLSPKLWEVMWRESDSDGGVTIDNTHVEEADLSNGSDGSSGNIDSDSEKSTINPNQELQDNIAGASGGKPRILFTVQIANDFTSYDTWGALKNDIDTEYDLNNKVNRHYWKMETLDYYSVKRGFYTQMEYKNPNAIYTPNIGLGKYDYLGISTPYYNGRSDLYQYFTFYDLETHWLIAEDSAREARLIDGEPRFVNETKGGSFINQKEKPWGRGESYLVQSRVTNLDMDDTFTASMMTYVSPTYSAETPSGYTQNVSPYYRNFYDPEIRELALQVTEGAVSDFDKAKAIEQWFHNEFQYTLTPGSPTNLSKNQAGKDRLHYFLLENREGYCTYFASGMVAMLRSLGINSRVAVGFAEGTYNGDLDAYVVTSEDAHAWVEVYFGSYGWLTFDPTSPRLTEEEKERQEKIEKEIKKETKKLEKELNENKEKKEKLNNPEEIFTPEEPSEIESNINEFFKNLDFAIRQLAFLIPLCCMFIILLLFSIPPIINLYSESMLGRKGSDLDERKIISNHFKLLERRLRLHNRSWKKSKSESAIQLVERVVTDSRATAQTDALPLPPELEMLKVAEIYNRAVFRHQLEIGDLENFLTYYDVTIKWVDEIQPIWKRVIGFWFPV